MAFHDVRLPDDVEQGATGGPMFDTVVSAMSSGIEQRNAAWSNARGTWQLAYGIQSYLDFDTVRAFFYARRGKAHSFRFKDWGDFSMTAEPLRKLTDGTLALGDGVNTQFQITKTYEVTGPNPYVRKITRPINSTVQVFVNGTAAAFTFGALGTVVLITAPAIGATVTVTCEFDVPVRFDIDQFNLQLDTPDAGAIGSLPVIEVRE